MENIKIKLIEYDRTDCFYSFIGMKIYGSKRDNDSFKFFFPIRDYSKAQPLLLSNKTYVLEEEVFLKDESIHTAFKGRVKKEIEEALERELKDPVNKKILIEAIFEYAYFM